MSLPSAVKKPARTLPVPTSTPTKMESDILLDFTETERFYASETDKNMNNRYGNKLRRYYAMQPEV